MVGLPSFFNKPDFFGKLLPGYVAVILYIVFFKPDLLIGTKSLSIDIFTAVVFVVAGPTAGYTLWQFHRSIYTIRALLPRKNSRNDREKDVMRYSKLRLKISQDEKNELNEVEANYDFGMSTGIVLVVIAVWYNLSRHTVDVFVILFLGLGALLLIEAQFHKKESYSPILNELFKNHGV